MRIECLEESVSLPLELGPESKTVSAVPEELLAAVAAGKIWHLFGWRDDRSNWAVFYRKKQFVAIELSTLKSLELEIMRPAKGCGWVGLDAVVANNCRVPLLQALRFDQEAVIWLLDKKSRIEGLFGKEIKVFDIGSDY